MEAEEDQVAQNPDEVETQAVTEDDADQVASAGSPLPPSLDEEKPEDGDPPGADTDGEIMEEDENLETTQTLVEEGDDGVVSDNKLDDDKGGGGEEDENVDAEEIDEDLIDTQEMETNEEEGEGNPREDDGNEISEEIEEEEAEGAPGERVEESSDEAQHLEAVASGGIATRKRTLSQSSGGEDGPKRKVGRNAGADGARSKHDRFCWVCHKEGVQVNCKLCPRSYHSKCMSMDYPNAKIEQDNSSCPCPECVVVMNAETIEFRSDSMKQLTLDQLMGLLKNVCLRMKQAPGADPFVKPVDPTDAEDYFDYVVYPMDIETLEKNIKKRLYGSTEGFLADAQWLVHNSIVFNSASSTYTLQAKRLLKICKQELTEIETCPECYLNAHEKPDAWFVEACRRPHILVWAKLKGFPFWPAKAMKIKDSDVDVRFFGQHDRAWVSMKDCYLYSEEMPVATAKKNVALLSAIEELTTHVGKLNEVHGPVIFATAKTNIGPQLSVEQIRRMLPEYNPPEQAAKNQSTASTPNVKTNPTTNNNNNNNKVPPPPKKSPMTIRISSLKTNPTIVNNSAVAAEDKDSGSVGVSSEARVVTRLTRKSSAAAQQNPAGMSESEQSTDENPTAEANSTEERQTESVPDDKANGTDDDDEAAQTVPKGSEILANALGGPLRRSTRGMSRSGDGSASHAMEPLTGAGAAGERRRTRSAVKGGSVVDGGDETDESSGQIGEDQPPDSVLEAMGLSKKSKDGSSPGRPLAQVKGEPTEHFNDSDGELNSDINAKPSNKNSQTLVEQLSAHSTTVKPGYRFNLSKDISISAVDGGGAAVEHADDYETPSAAVGSNMRMKRPNPTIGQQRGVPQAIPMGVGGGLRPRVQPNSSILNGQQQQRMFTEHQLRQMVRNARPQHILNPRTGQTVRIAGVPPANRPVSIISARNPQQQHPMVQKSIKDGSVAADSSSLGNTVQGPITLPGGTITVTPLSLMNAGVQVTSFDGTNVAQSGQHVAIALKSNSSASAVNLGIINVQQQSSGGTTIVNSAGGGTKSTKAGITSVQQRRNLMASIPPTVSMHLQNLTKTMGDLVKSTVEQITLEVIEYCNNTQGKAETNRLQLELERAQNKLKQEVTDVKHNNDIALRELRITMENDKKRAIAEIKRQMETDKQKAIEETKKKQWCASCGREALFYCCWNTSYCGYPCQEEHWPAHMASCSQSSR